MYIQIFLINFKWLLSLWECSVMWRYFFENLRNSNTSIMLHLKYLTEWLTGASAAYFNIRIYFVPKISKKCKISRRWNFVYFPYKRDIKVKTHLRATVLATIRLPTTVKNHKWNEKMLWDSWKWKRCNMLPKFVNLDVVTRRRMRANEICVERSRQKKKQ